MKTWFLLILIISGFVSASAQSSQLTANASLSSKEYEELMIPNAFTPNGDGQNDVFKVANLSNQQIIEFKIFNRWGTVLYKTTDRRSGWDGTYKGSPQPFGVYGYVIRIAYSDGYVATYKGTVTLIR